MNFVNKKCNFVLKNFVLTFFLSFLILINFKANNVFALDALEPQELETKAIIDPKSEENEKKQKRIETINHKIDKIGLKDEPTIDNLDFVFFKQRILDKVFKKEIDLVKDIFINQFIEKSDLEEIRKSSLEILTKILTNINIYRTDLTEKFFTIEIE
ncbi:MAG: putative secreted protein [Candidatus Phytoplasma cynodontis]|uniref:hypothetical protein n=1 Tax='Cynodon dactylon' phytoplasma TaxID=295320 RepID=UPI001265C001|nr:hypothetical protein ['Cynodon dactylon' phytoplasma]KAB8121794.1 hypothetical protein F1741_01540 ['Cynodon dactylon' phytoplasma]WIA07746.1 MAG: putative secreted protein [Candidatus Phytoplasma cynodontis]